MSTVCTKRDCTARTFMDSDRCFDHQRMPSPPKFFLAWFAFVALVAGSFLVLFAWALIELVTWVTS